MYELRFRGESCWDSAETSKRLQRTWQWQSVCEPFERKSMWCWSWTGLSSSKAIKLKRCSVLVPALFGLSRPNTDPSIVSSESVSLQWKQNRNLFFRPDQEKSLVTNRYITFMSPKWVPATSLLMKRFLLRFPKTLISQPSLAPSQITLSSQTLVILLHAAT